MTPTVSDVLDLAADKIERRGWCQGQLTTLDGRMCAVGAISSAVYTLLPLSSPSSGTPRERTDLMIDAADALGDVVCDPDDRRVPIWNDTKGRTKTEVLDAFRKAAKLAKIREETTMSTDYTLVCTPEEFLAAPPAERVKLVLAQIDAHPELWDQGTWMRTAECGTTACVAGWTCLLAGAKPLSHTDQYDDVYVSHDGIHRIVAQLATELLGLTDDQADDLFWETNTRQDLDAVLDGTLTDTWRHER